MQPLAVRMPGEGGALRGAVETLARAVEGMPGQGCPLERQYSRLAVASSVQEPARRAQRAAACLQRALRPQQ